MNRINSCARPASSFICLTATLFLASAGSSTSAKDLHSITLTAVGSYASGLFDEGAAEIVSYDPVSQNVFAINAFAAQLDAINISDPTHPTKVATLDLLPYGAVADSVSVHNGIVAVVVQDPIKTNPGRAIFFDSNLNFLAQVTVGSQPDMVAFTPDGRYALTADEAEPNDTYTVDPEGSVSIIDLSGGVANLTQANVRTARFDASVSIDPGVRIFGPGATVAQDLEPEYIAISHDSKTAWVTCQENNAIAILDINAGTFTHVVALGAKDHNIPRNGFDASDRDGKINIRPWPVKGLYMPDGIAAYKIGNETFLVTANEGDVREWGSYVEAVRVGSSSVVLDPVKFPNAVDLKKTANLGRLNISIASGRNPATGFYEELYSFGARSFSIWTAQGSQVFDSGNDFELITAFTFPNNFNASNSSNDFDNRSDDKGPEPEGVTLGKVFGSDYAFICLERIGGIMIYDISNPYAPEFVDYVNRRDFTQPVTSLAAGDLGPEGLAFVKEEDSPNGKPLLIVGNEISGTTTIYQIDKSK